MGVSRRKNEELLASSLLVADNLC